LADLPDYELATIDDCDALGVSAILVPQHVAIAVASVVDFEAVTGRENEIASDQYA
jgi:hypothetical protein